MENKQLDKILTELCINGTQQIHGLNSEEISKKIRIFKTIL